MADNIDRNQTGQDRAAYVKAPAWHRKGIVYDEPVLPSVAIKDANVDYGVSKVPLLLPSGLESGYSAILREEGGETTVYGIGKEYELVHISEIVESLDSMPWPLSAVGAIDKGATIFAAFDLGNSEILGESYRNYLGITHPYRPGTSWKAMLTPVRMVCENTVVAATGAATTKITVVHKAGAGKRIDAAMMAAKAKAMQERLTKMLESMAKLELTYDEADKILAQVYPYVRPEPAYVVDKEAAAKKRESQVRYVEGIKRTTLQLYDTFNSEYPSLANTGYALYQAVTESADYRKGHGKADERDAKVAENALFGTRAQEKVRAFELLASVN